MVKIYRGTDFGYQPDLDFHLKVPTDKLSDGHYVFTLTLEGEDTIFTRSDSFIIRTKTIAGDLVPMGKKLPRGKKLHDNKERV